MSQTAWGCRSGAQAGEVFGGSPRVGGWGCMGKGGARCCCAALGAGIGGGWRPVWSERQGNSGGCCGARARHSKLHRYQDTSLWRGCSGTVIPKSRAAVPVVRLRVEEMCQWSGAQELPHQASPCVHLCQDPHVSFQMAQHKHGLLAPRSPSCIPAGAVRCRKLQVVPRWWDAML